MLTNAWEMPVLELSNWYALGEDARKEAIGAYVDALTAWVDGLSASGLTTDIRNATEISTPSVLLSIPADQALAGLKGVNGQGDGEPCTRTSWPGRRALHRQQGPGNH